MYKKLLTSTIALSVAFGPMASAESYMFRYRSPLIETVQPQPPGEEYGVGNDIHAYYTAPIGYDFEKRIPVATQDVTEWRKDSGDWPDGIELDETTGEMAGSPTTVERQKLLYHGYDSSGNRIARAELNFTVFQPVGLGEEISYYAHTGKYFFEKLPIPPGVDVYRWDAVTDFPEGVSANGLSLQGTPVAAGEYGLAFRGYDFMGREVAFLYGALLVQDGPVIDPIGDQEIDLLADEQFDVLPTVAHKLGDISYTLVSETGRPQGLTFAASTGALTGAYRTFDTQARFHIVAKDTYDGTTGRSNSFKLATLPASVDLAGLGDQQGTVNDEFALQLAFPGLQSGATWVLKHGTWPEGITLDAATGLVSGTPTRMQKAEGLVIELSGPAMTTVESPAFSFEIFPEKLKAEADPLVARTNTPFSTRAPAVVSGNVAPVTYEVSGSSQGFARAAAQSLVDLDARTGAVISPGLSAAGSYGVTMVATNGDGQKSSPIVQGIEIYNPLSIAYAPGTVKRLQSFVTDPVIGDDSIVAPATFKLVSGNLPAWLSLDSSTGQLTGTPADASSVGSVGPLVIQISDATGQKELSNAFSFEVEERVDMSVALVDQSVERFVGNARQAVTSENGWKDIKWSVVSGAFPSSSETDLKFTTDGYLSGVTKDPVGTEYGPFVLEAVDADGQTRQVGPFKVTVIEPGALKPLTGSLDKALTWTVGVPFTVGLPALSNTYGGVTYALSGIGAGITIDPSTGAVTGTLTETGVTSHAYTVKDDTARPAAGGTLTLTMLDPMTITADELYVGNQGTAASFRPVVENAIGKVVYGPLSGNLPKGLSYANGIVKGTPEVVGPAGPFSFTATDEAGTSRTATFGIRIDAPLPFSFAHKNPLMTSGIWHNRSPNPVNEIGTVKYVLAGGTLPKGIRLLSSKGYNGHLTGTPKEIGRFPGITIIGTDPNYDLTSTADDLVHTETIEIGVQPYYGAELVDQTFKVRKGIASTNMLQTRHVVAPLVFDAPNGAVLPHGLVVNGTTGAMTGTFPDAGKYAKIKVRVTDTFGRKGTGNIAFEVLEPVSISYPAGLAFNQHIQSAVRPSSVSNVIGTLSYALAPESAPLPAGLSVDPSTGVIGGQPGDKGDFPGIIVQATDSFDGVAQKSAAFSVKVDERLDLTLASPGDIILKRWGNASAQVKASNAIGGTTFAISPPLPAGLSFDTSDGTISGYSADLVESATYQVTATDSKSGAARTSFTLAVVERDPLEISAATSFEFNQFFQGSFAATGVNVIGKATWSISPALPSWATFLSGVVSGKPQSKEPASSYTVTLSDAHDTTSKVISISVGDRKPLQIKEPHTVPGILNSQLSAALAVENPVGAVVWKLVSGTMPEGVFFDEATGSFGGVPTEFGISDPIIISAEDGFGGSVRQAIVIDVKASSTPVQITVAASSAHTGQAYVGVTPTVIDGIGTLTFTATGLSGTGLSIDPATGVISGTPIMSGRISPIVTVTDIAGRKAVVAVVIDVAGPLEATLPSVMAMVYNYAPATNIKGSATNVVAPASWSLASGTLPRGVGVDPVTGSLVGKPKELGEFGPIVLKVEDSTGVSALTGKASIHVEMNDDPISLSVRDFSTHVGYPVRTAPPTFDNEVGTVSYFSTDASTFGLTLDPATGILSGTVGQTLDAFVNVSIRDSGTSRVTSRPVHVTIVPPQQITAPATVRIVAGERTRLNPFTRQYAVGNAGWSGLDPAGPLPEGLIFDASEGAFIGSTDELGRFGPFTVTSTDSVGDVQRSNSFNVEVVTGSLFLGLAQGAVPDGEKRSLYAGFDFKTLLTAAGVDESAMTWSMSADTGLGEKVPPGLSVTGGQLSGTPTAEGSFTFDLKVAGGGTSATQKYTIIVKLPSTTLTLADTTLAEAGLKVAYTDDFKNYLTVVNIPKDKLKWVMQAVPGSTPTQTLPTGIALGAATGMFAGTPTKAPITSDATFHFTVTVSFQDGTENLSSTAAFKLPFKTGGVVQTATGGTNSCFLTTAGGVKCAGSGPNGENGSGTTGSRVTATDVTGLTSGVQQIDSGMIYACALTDDGAVKCWGNNSNAEMGDGTTTRRTTPVTVTGLNSGVARISTGWAHACALMNDQTLRCWGRNANGQIGNGNTTNQRTPVTIDVGGPVEDVYAGYNNTCALLVDATVKCWGANNYYQLGDIGTANRTTPVTITGYTGTAKQVTGGSGFTCVLSTAGQMQCMGLNLNGRFGDGTTGTTSNPRRTFSTTLLSDIKVMSSGITNNCAITNTNGVYCWGDNTYGNVGDATTTDRNTPVRLPALDGKAWVNIDVNDDHQCAASDDGIGMCWGWGAQGRLGNAVDSAKAYGPVTVVF